MVVLQQETVNGLLQLLDRVNGVEAIIRLPILPQEYQEPLFSLKLDVFLSTDLPDFELRRSLIPDARHFEASRRKPKDRFFWRNIPIHVEYKLCRHWEEQLEAVRQSQFHWDGSTYPFFRVAEGIVLKDQSGWVHRQKEALLQLPDHFYSVHLGLLRDRLEHLTSDLAIATFSSDALMFQMSLGKYLETLVEGWFTLNRSFMPPFDQVQTRLRQLEYLPEGALGLLDVLTRADVDMARRFEVAKKAALSLI